MNGLVANALSRIGIKPRVSHYAYSEEAIARLVEQNIGISIVAKTDNLNSYRVKVLHPYWLGTDGRENYMMYHKLRHHGKGVKHMMEFIIQNRDMSFY